MTIIEQSLTPKSPAKKTEDAIVVTDDFVAVIDGSTSKATHNYHPFRSNGRQAMKTVQRVVRNAKPDMTVQQFCTQATSAMMRNYQHWAMLHATDIKATLTSHPEQRMAASAAVFSRLRREVWLVGDCQCLINGQLFDNPKPYEQQLAEARAREARRLLDSGTTIDQLRADDKARQTIIPAMIEAMKKQNIDYAVIDGFPIPQSKVKVITLSFETFDVVLATDGYPVLCPSLDESEAALKQQLNEDPLCIAQFKATKAWMEGNRSFDDRAYIRIKV